MDQRLASHEQQVPDMVLHADVDNVPRFLERDEAEREAPYARFPWDGVSGVRPYRAFAATTTVGVY